MVDQSVPDENLIVHSYVSNSIDHLASPSNVLERGRILVRAVSNDLKWRTVTANRSGPQCYAKRGKNAYVFALDVPPTENEYSSQASSHELREWGSSVLEEEAFSLDELDEFQSTELDYLLHSVYASTGQYVPEPPSGPDVLRHHNSRETALPGSQKSNRPASLYWERDSKHSLDVDTSPLYMTIPQPHYHGYPPLPSIPRAEYLRSRNVPPYTKMPPITLPPYTPTTDFFSQNGMDTRCAWIIPLRGKLPWEGCTSARLVSGAQASELGVVKSEVDGGDACITWTRDALPVFWQFLLDLRKMEVFGPLGLSFHAVAPSAGIDTSNGNTTHTVEKPTLLATDHFKVYHDAELSMFLRTMFDVWVHHFPPRAAQNTKKETNKQTKVRMLKHARLVLVDGINQGVLIA